MQRNVGALDRSTRIIAGLAVIGAGIYFKSWWGAVGAIPLLTAAVGWCPLYAPFGLSTCAPRPAGKKA